MFTNISSFSHPPLPLLSLSSHVTHHSPSYPHHPTLSHVNHFNYVFHANLKLIFYLNARENIKERKQSKKIIVEPSQIFFSLQSERKEAKIPHFLSCPCNTFQPSMSVKNKVRGLSKHCHPCTL